MFNEKESEDVMLLALMVLKKMPSELFPEKELAQVLEHIICLIYSGLIWYSDKFKNSIFEFVNQLKQITHLKILQSGK